MEKINLLSTFFVMKSSISVDIKKLMQRGAYESVLYDLMNVSSLVFPGHYKHIKKQSNGECDFIEINDETKYDAKLVITTQLGKNFLSRNGSVNNYIQEMHKEAIEFSDHFQTERKKIEEFTLYKVITENIEKTQEDENVILFIPYPIVPDAENFPLKGAKDFLTFIYQSLVSNKKVGSRKIYVIYLAYDGKTVLRNMGTGEREYVDCPKLNEYITYLDFDIEKIIK